MGRYAGKTIQNKSTAAAQNMAQLKKVSAPADAAKIMGDTVQLKLQQQANAGAQAVQLKKYQDMADNFTAGVIQKKENKTGMPDQLKAGIEYLSGYSMDDVKVHYNSSQPSQVQAHAYAQGTNIHVAPGQEQHLPHEAWHIVQQKQGRVKPTMQMKGLNVNDSSALEMEADSMGAKAAKS